jgi:hypothetical protein
MIGVVQKSGYRKRKMRRPLLFVALGQSLITHDGGDDERIVSCVEQYFAVIGQTASKSGSVSV